MECKICFRADASAQIGYGHFIRTLALADMLKDDFDCVFYTSEPTPYQKKQMEKVCRFVGLREESKFEDFLVNLDGTEIVVLDNYFFTTDYQRQIKAKGCKLVCIDDIHNIHYVADAVINHSLGLTPHDFSTAPYTKLYLGLSYVLLRKPFLQTIDVRKPMKLDNKNLRVVISFGGGDKHNLTSRYINAIKDIPSVKTITALIGDGYCVQEKAIQSNVIYRKNLSAKDMVNLFSNNDIAILPASTIMKEALACNMIVIGGYFVDNQIHSYNVFCKMNAIIKGGDFVDNKTIESVRQILSSFATTPIKLNTNLIPTNVVANLISIFHHL